MIKNLPEIITNAQPIQQILLLLFLILFVLRFIGEILFLLRILWHKNKSTDTQNSLSIYVTLRNEEKNISKNIPEILQVNNVDFEVIVVDDFSLDNSLSVLGTLKNGNSKLKVSSLNQETRFSVKLAQNIAIKAAAHEWLLQVPVSIVDFHKHWLKQFAHYANENSNVIMGYSNVLPERKFFNYLYRIECFYKHIQSAGFILNGLPFVYFEENVAFKKEHYFKCGGFGKKMNETHANLELIINQFIRKKTTQISFNSETAIRKSVQIERSDYFDLLKKSCRIEKNLTGLKRFVLHLNSFIKLLYLPVSIAVIILFTDVWMVVAMLVGVLGIKHLFIIKILQNRLNERKIFISSLVYDLIMPYFKVIYRWQFNRRSRKQKWRSNI